MPQLNFKQPMTTNQGHSVKFYEIYSDRIHGAYFNDDTEDWKLAMWSFPSGYCIFPSSKLDLINEEPYIAEEAD